MSIPSTLTADRFELVKDRLSAEHRQVLELFFRGGDPRYVTIAGALELKVGTVKSRLNRARAQVAKLNPAATPCG